MLISKLQGFSRANGRFARIIFYVQLPAPMSVSIDNPLVTFHAISTPTVGTVSRLFGYYYARVPVAY
jgi:hypothetical protein